MVKKAICNLFTFFIHFLVPGSEDDPGSRAGSSDLKPIYNSEMNITGTLPPLLLMAKS